MSVLPCFSSSLQLVYCLFVDQKEPTSDASTPSSPRLAPPTKRTRRELTSEPSSSDTSPSPQAKGQRVSWDIPTYCTRSVIDKKVDFVDNFLFYYCIYVRLCEHTSRFLHKSTNISAVLFNFLLLLHHLQCRDINKLVNYRD